MSERVVRAILETLGQAGAGRSVSPSDIARALTPPEPDGPDWRRMLGPVRAEALRLAQAGRIEILRKGKPCAPGEVRGVIRLRIAGGTDFPRD